MEKSRDRQSAGRWERIEELFAACVDETPGARKDRLDRACAGDPDLRREVESLLAAHETPGGILDGPAPLRAGAAGASPQPAGPEPAGLLAPGTRLGPWRVGPLIGRGGAGEVYVAERGDGAFEQKVAVKVLQPEAAAQLQRFHAERRILARLEHPGIARLLDGGVTEDGRPYAVLEYVEGHPLVEHCRAQGCGLEERLRLFGQVCEAVAHAHRNLVVHRDLKPGNILVGADGRVKLLDFGIAKLLDAGAPADAGTAADLTRAPLTPDYAAPEQLTGEPVTTATDVYALGVLLFELLTGERPWRSGDLPVATAVRLLLEKEAPTPSRLAREARRPGLPVPAGALEGDLDAIVAKCLRKEPEHRYESVAALWQDVERHLRREPVRAREGARLYVLGRLLLRHRWAVAGVAAVFLSLAAGLGAFAWQARQAALERDLAQLASSREEAIRDHLTRLFRSSLAEPASGPASEPISAKTMLDRSAQRVLLGYKDDPQLAGEVVETLADLYGALGDVEGQAPLLEGFLAAAGPEADPRAVALARQKLANIELVRGKPERAAPLLDQAEAFWAKDPERFREARLEGLFVRAQLERSQGDLDGSIATYQEAIRERTALSGEAQREVANLNNSLAITLTAANRFDEALAAHRHALKIYERIGRGEDLEALVLRGNIGTLAFRTGRVREAQEILETAWRKQRAAAGDSAAVAASMGLYGAALTARGRAAEALPVLREALDMAARFTGPTSPLTVQDRQFLTDALAATGDLHAARATLAENLEISRREFGPDHILTLRLRLAQARLAQLAGQPAEAYAQVAALLPALRKLGGQSGSWIAHAQVVAGDALLALGRPAEAAEALREAVEIREELLWSGSWELAEARARLGEALAATGDPEGRPLLEKAEAALKAELGAEHPQTVRAGRALANVRRGGPMWPPWVGGRPGVRPGRGRWAGVYEGTTVGDHGRHSPTQGGHAGCLRHPADRPYNRTLSHHGAGAPRALSAFLRLSCSYRQRASSLAELSNRKGRSMSSRPAAVLLLVLTCAFGAARTARPATVTVTGTGDTTAVDGSVTLREALASINGAANVNADVVAVGAYGASDTIAFNIPGAGPHTISVGATPLPVIVRPVLIDGYTEPGSSVNTLDVGDDAVLNIVLQGTTAGIHGLEVSLAGSGSVIRGLVMQRHFFAFQIGASNVTLTGNFIGTNQTATAADATTTNSVGVNIQNGNIGNNIIGGSLPSERNVISGNAGGIIMNSQLPNTIWGNYIGVNGAGTAALPNTASAIYIGSLGAATIGGATIGGPTAVAGQGLGNVISGNGSPGIQIQTGGLPTVIGAATIQGNILGLDANGINPIPNTGANILLRDTNLPVDGIPRLGPVTIGGSVFGAGNVLASGGHGVFAVAAGTIIRGNRIGTDITGTLARPNTFGIEITGSGAFVSSATIGGTGANEGNIISGNLSDGVRLFLATASVEGSSIGVSSMGSPLGNGGYGIFVDSGLATIGGTAAGAGNTIANNGDTGVQVRIGFSGVRDASEATILGNSITGNGLLGINNSAPDVVTANDGGDGDTGPNDLQNFPVITTATLGGGNVTVSGTLNSTAGTTFRVEIFSNAACDGLGFGEGATYLGFVDVTTDGSGNGSFGPSVFTIPAGQPVITATATSPTGHTSEFSSCVTAAGGPPPLPTLSINNVSANEGNAGTTAFTFTVTLSAASATPVTVSYATADGSATTAGSDYLSAAGLLTFTPGGPLTQTVTVNVVGDLTVEANETFTVTLSAPTGATLGTAQGTGTLVNDDAVAPGSPAEEIPTLSEWGILLLAGALALLGMLRMARLRRAV